MKKAAGFVLKLGITVLLFVLLFFPEWLGLRADLFGGVKPWDLLKEIREAGAANVGLWLTLGLIIKLAGMLCGVLRWRILLHGQGLSIPFGYLTGSWFIGRSIGIYLPGTLGLDGYRFYDSSRYTGEVIKCGTVIAVEKLIGFISLTGLVFITFPMGFRLLDIKIPVLAAILVVLGGAVTFFFLLLLNPRVIQVLVAVFPAPAAVRRKLDRLGVAATAYSGSRMDLMLAVLLGVAVHGATCLLFFCTMMAIRAENTSLLDIMFASPLMIYGTVIGPSIGGEGIREIVFAGILGQKSGMAAAITFAHLGWWVGDVAPYLIGVAVFLLRQRPDKGDIETALADARARSAEIEGRVLLHLSPEQVAHYRGKVYAFLSAGALSGILAGAVLGLAEAHWLARTLSGLTELGMYWWGPMVYGPLFACVGLGVAAGLLFLGLLAARFFSWNRAATFSFGGALAGGALIIGLFRYQRDVLESHAAGLSSLLTVAAVLLGAAVVATLIFDVVCWMLAGWDAKGSKRLAFLSLGVYLTVVLCGAGYGRMAAPEQAAPAPPAAKATGPNVVFIGIDTLRADALKLYRPEAPARTPNMEVFAADSVLFEQAIAQASWTKPSFATLLTGLYPSAHTATSKTAAIPESVETLAELLQAGGYTTQGFANNPNTFAMFGFGQGFADYTELRPRVLFFASPSATRLSMYEVLRKGRQRVLGKIPVLGKRLGKMVISDFYQPADEVTRVATEWLGRQPEQPEAPFFLFLHYMDPHDPFLDPEAPGGGFARARMETPEPEMAEPMRKAYVRGVEHLDTHLGGLFSALKARGLYDDTLIVLVSDHGEEFLEHGGWWHGFTLYEEMIHIPMIIKLPGKAHAGERNTDLARHVDVAPTILHLAGLNQGARMTGLPLYDSQTGFGNAGAAWAYAENDFEGNVLRAVRTPEAKLIEALETKEERLKPLEFYRLPGDPAEKNNLAEQEPDAVTPLRAIIGDFQKTILENAAEPAAPAALDAGAREQLESLGYLDTQGGAPEMP